MKPWSMVDRGSQLDGSCNGGNDGAEESIKDDRRDRRLCSMCPSGNMRSDGWIVECGPCTGDTEHVLGCVCVLDSLESTTVLFYELKDGRTQLRAVGPGMDVVLMDLSVGLNGYDRRRKRTDESDWIWDQVGSVTGSGALSMASVLIVLDGWLETKPSLLILGHVGMVSLVTKEQGDSVKYLIELAGYGRMEENEDSKVERMDGLADNRASRKENWLKLLSLGKFGMDLVWSRDAGMARPVCAAFVSVQTVQLAGRCGCCWRVVLSGCFHAPVRRSGGTPSARPHTPLHPRWYWPSELV
ncbi:hypothetical protein Bca52824_001288 [Brassica carinata]|uniref:Uncharacterized protein n=1 Tax=Brassica carinata TaxID=52824 RepID=A0A8X7WFS5_BRACI|nr:hypothetical protein Bca52824_001288 [Brassica carinata]